MEKNRSNGFTLIEMSIVILIFCLSIGVFFGAKKMIKMSRLANAINLTAQLFDFEDDSLVLWLETSTLSRDNKTGLLYTWRDISKNRKEFTSHSGALEFSDSKVYFGLKSVKFDGINYFESPIALNLNQYTLFTVVVPEAGLASSTRIFDSGFVATVGELSNNHIVVIENTGSAKYIKSVKDTNFTLLASNPDNLSTPQPQFFIGNDGFKGEFFGMMVFNRILDETEIKIVEEYLINKYLR
ncbi:MAG: prepilin-type N-terminal cleavage/methylation domain-containing protein [Rickettsiales bacterium]|nr:prepilin-type N-terminal cleavage/methylation domain-containing protein [Rickettsiales bacterium]